MQPLPLPSQVGLEILPGRDRAGHPVFFLRCFHAKDLLHHGDADNPTFCGYPLNQWLAWSLTKPEDVWDCQTLVGRRTGWNARLFPAERDAQTLRRWSWLFEAEHASPQQFQQWAVADRYSLHELALLADRDAVLRQGLAIPETITEEQLQQTLRQFFQADSAFSASDLACLLTRSAKPTLWLKALIDEAREHWHRTGTQADEAFIFPRLLHSLGSAIAELSTQEAGSAAATLTHLNDILYAADADWCTELGLEPAACDTPSQWTIRTHNTAFAHLRTRIVSSGEFHLPMPRSSLRSDEIVWGRAPVRLDLGGGWSDTPPYSLEHGGTVINAAVDLNGQPPIQVYARLVPKLHIRCHSIDVGSQLDLNCWEDLLDFRSPTAEFALVKAALVLSGFAPVGKRGKSSLQALLADFGGGLELTTLSAIPKGSGLGTSSILGAVVLAVLHRILSRVTPPRELFHLVLRLEQSLTTGGGWQDQIGGTMGGLKVIRTRPGLVPDATISYVPPDLLTAASRGGAALLYYTGITRLAKNILEQVVGRYLDRDREALAILNQLPAVAEAIAEATAQKDLPRFGQLLSQAWQLNKRLDVHSTNEEIDALLASVEPYVYGAKLLGAGGGGFLLLIGKSPDAAFRLQRMLQRNPSNSRARFFDFAVNQAGLEVSVC